MSKKLLFYLLMAAIVLMPLLKTRTAAAAFSQNNLMDDAIFTNSNTMSAAQIDAFLNTFPSSCISPNNGFSDWEPVGYTPSGGYVYGDKATAGKIIFDLSKVYGINPQVFLTTLQKEQSLVSGSAGCYPNTPDPNNTFQCNLWGTGNIACTPACPYGGGCITIALGNNCPNNCQASTEGFSKQLTTAAWKWKYWQQRSEGNVGWNVQVRNFPYAGNVWDNSDDVTPGSFSYCYSGLRMTEGYYRLCPNGSYATYDGLTVVRAYSGGPAVTVHLDNGATASLYNWTPFLSGNQNFVNIFENWFGPTKGTVLIKGSGPTVYLLGSSPSKAYGIPSGEVLKAYGLQNVAVTGVDDAYLASLDTSGTLTTLFMKPNDGTIYLADSGRAYGIANGAICNDWGLPCGQASLVSTLPYVVTSTMFTDHPLTNLMLYQNTVFQVSGNTKRPFIGPNDLGSSPYAGQALTGIASPLNSFQSVGTPAFYSSQFFKTANNAIYYFNAPSNQYFRFSDFENFKNWWDGSPISNDWFSSFNSTPPVSSLANNFVTSNGNPYYINEKNAYSLPSTPSSTTPTNLAISTGLNSLFQTKTISNAIDGSSALRIPVGAIFTLQAGSLMPVPTLTDVSLQFPQKVINIPASFLDGYPVGKFYIPPARIIKLSGSDAINMYGSDKYLWGIPTLGQVGASLFWVNNVLETAPGNIDSLGTKTYVSIVNIGGTYYAVQSNGSIRPIPASYLSSSKDTYATPLSGPITAKMVVDGKAISFIHTDNSAIYYLQSNSLRPLNSFSTYGALGGNPANTLELPSAAIPAFNVGSPL